MNLPPILSHKRKLLFILLIGNGLLQAFGTVSITFLIKSIFDQKLSTTLQPTFNLWQMGFMFLFIAIFLAWLKFRERADAELVGQDYVHETRLKMFSHYCNSDLSETELRSKGAIGLRFATDLSALRQWISLGLSRLIVASINLVITLGALCVINFKLGAVVTLIILTNIALSLSLGKSLRSTINDARRQRSQLANNLNEKVTSMATVKMFGQRQREKNRVNRQSSRVMEAMCRRANLIGILRALGEGSTILTTAMVVIIGVVLMNEGQATPGTVVAALGIISLLMQPLRHLGRVYEYKLNASVAKEKIKLFLDLPPSTPEKQRKIRLGHGDLELKKVVFFSDSKEVNLHISAGKKIAILGANGAGKSSILAQFAGLLKPASGDILLGENNVCKLKDSALRQSVGMVSHNLPLLKGSIKKNLCYRMQSASDEEISRIVKRCGLENLLESLPDGLDTRLKEGGKNLSQGERQRIALARALIGTPEILILDEADAFLDEEGVTLFADIIKDYPGIIIMATHNIDHVAITDEVWLIEKGELRWNGPREKLSMDLYAELFIADQNGYQHKQTGVFGA